MSGHLSETIKVRVERDTRTELERQAKVADRTPSYLARVLIREGLERRKAAETRASRGR